MPTSHEIHVRNALPIAAVILLAAACNVEKNAGSADTTGSSRAAAPRSAPPTPGAPTPGTPGRQWAVAPNGIGPVQVGMTSEELRRAAGEFTVPSGAGSACAYVRPSKAPRGVSVMLAQGRVARVDVDSSGVQSEGGVSVGDTAEKVTEAFGSRVAATPHKYVPGGQYLTVTPASPNDSTLRIVFETADGRVTRFRSGRLPEVQWVERCG